MILIAVICAIYPLRELVFTRIANQDVATEQISTLGRAWLEQQAFRMIMDHPAGGVGIASFTLELAESAVAGAPIEPVHSLFLLVTAELGFVGCILLFCLFFSIALTIYKSTTPHGILAGALVAGVGVISLFDHYFWTLAPGRVMLGLALGLWAGQVAEHG
jgi:O-antigen ligase